MARHVAFLRAVNVAGHGRVRMHDVREAFVAAGGSNVETVIQSGNVLFESPRRDVSKIAASAGRALQDLLGEAPLIIVRPGERLAELIDQNPFRHVAANSQTKLYVVLLSRRPQRQVVFPLVSTTERLEAIGIDGQDVFVVSRPKKSGFLGFPNNFIEQELGVNATSRNWSTITRLVERAAR